MTKEERTVTIVRVDPWRLKSENYGNKTQCLRFDALDTPS
jgi:hypothetical protein